MSASATERLMQAVRSGQAPQPIRSAAARGALPLPAEELAEIQVLLLEDAEKEIAAAARTTLEGMDATLVLSLAAEEGLSQDLARFIAASWSRWEEGAARLARRPDLPGEAARELAESEASAVLEALAGNQSLVAKFAGLGELLAENESLPKGARNRLLDVLDEIAKTKSDDAGADAESAAASDVAEEPAKDPFLAALGIDAEVEAMLPELGLDIESLSEKSELLGDDDDDDGLYGRVSKMNVGQKLRLALFGTRSERTLLVRDSNRIVAKAVVKNPKFTEQEADAVSKSRNVNQDVLRLIAQHRDFSKAYSIQHNLVCNPRCPVEVSFRLVPRLNERDLKLLLKNRNVPEGVRRHAEKTMSTRSSRRSGRSR